MKWTVFSLAVLAPALLAAQAPGDAKSNRYTSFARLFLNEKPVEMIMTTDLKKMHAQKDKGHYQDALLTIKLNDSLLVNDSIKVYERGIFRRQNCITPGIMMNFKSDKDALSNNLKHIKLVRACSPNGNDEQLLLKEYLVYKIYNLLTDVSFRVRLVKVTYDNAPAKKGSYTQYGFILESMEGLASRLQSKELKSNTIMTEQTDRAQTTLVTIFQYMIGNTDWSIPVRHNIKLIQAPQNPSKPPIVIPYDFDFAGIVNAPYAAPAPELGIENVTDRVYRGFPRNMDELKAAVQVFENQKQNIYSLIQNFDLLNKRDRDEMIKYLNEFYSLISNDRDIRHAFIDDARRN
jgi:hypothetical protein